MLTRTKCNASNVPNAISNYGSSDDTVHGPPLIPEQCLKLCRRLPDDSECAGYSSVNDSTT